MAREAFRGSDGKIAHQGFTVCVVCGFVHLHGYLEGHRVSHCRSTEDPAGGSYDGPMNIDGYFLWEAGPLPTDEKLARWIKAGNLPGRRRNTERQATQWNAAVAHLNQIVAAAAKQRP